MPERIVLSLDLTTEEHHRLEALAQQRGYRTPSEYLRALVESDAIVQSDELDFDTKEGVMAGLRESWHQAMTGHTRPISELCDPLDEE